MKDRTCFADSGVGCQILEEQFCPGCAFYKTRAKLKQQRKRSVERLEQQNLMSWVKWRYQQYGGIT